MIKNILHLILSVVLLSTLFSQDPPEEFQFSQSTLQGFYFFEDVTLDGTPIESNDWIGVFKGDICVGARQWDISNCGGGLCDLPTMGNDGSDYTIGYMEIGDIPTFKIYDASTGNVINAIAYKEIGSSSGVDPWSINGFSMNDLLEGVTLDSYYQVDLPETGSTQLTILSDSITGLEIGDEIGIFDENAITNYNDCSNQIGELLVGTGVWNGDQLNLVSIGSNDLCSFGGVQISGFVEGNPVAVKVWRASEEMEYAAELTWGTGSGLFGDIIQSVSEISLSDPNACEDDDTAVDAFGGCAGAVAALGCDFVFAGVPVSESCPVTCDNCPDITVPGCMDSNSCNYDPDATDDDGSCEFATDNFDCDGNCLIEVDCAGECGGSAEDLGCGCGVAGPSGCDNACGSTLELDECGVCDGDGPADNLDCDGNCVVEIDCLGECGGSAYEITLCEDTDDDGLGNPGSETTECVAGGRDVSDGCDLPLDNILLNSDGSVVYNASSNIGGFQFNVDGANINSASGGDAAGAGFMVSASGNLVLGFSMTGTNFGPCGTMTNLDLSGEPTGLSGILIADSVGGPLDFIYYVESGAGLVADCSDMYPDCTSNEVDCLGECNGSAVLDCALECGGLSVVDDCGVCGGDNSTCIDCFGIPNGSAEDLGCGCGVAGPSGCDNVCGSNLVDDGCGVCGGDDSDDLGCGCFEPGPSGCDNVCGSDLVDDDCGVCGGDNSTCDVDCAGVEGGDALQDMCGICDNDPDNDCIEDCAGEWGGLAELDDCGLCGGESICNGEMGPSGQCLSDDFNVGEYDISGFDCYGFCFGTFCFGESSDCYGQDGADGCYDCANTPYGYAIEDDCGICSGGESGHTANIDQDCDGICFGTNLEDECGVCGGDGSDDLGCGCFESGPSGCDNECGSTLEFDECGVCGGDGSDDLGCGCFEPGPSGCDDTCDSDLEFDECGVCGGDGSDDLGCGCFEPGPSGCDNTCGSDLEFDECGVCGGDGPYDGYDCFGEIICVEYVCLDFNACNYYPGHDNSFNYEFGFCNDLSQCDYESCRACDGELYYYEDENPPEYDGCVSDENPLGVCGGNGWDYCDDDEDGVYNKDQYGYGAHSLSVIDVPNDQGGYLYLSFNRSAYDTDILTNTVFDLYSDDFDDELFFANFGSEGYVIERFDNEVWTAVQSLFAYGSDTYQVEVRTLSDSTSVSNSLAEYRVIAAMTEGNFESLSTVIGYSVDNIAPMVPTSFTGSYDSELGRAVLSWDPSNANDISHYNVYKNETLYTSINDITFSENIVGDAEYSISAVDIHENESMLTEPVYMAELSINEELIITDFRLLPAYPNPFNPITTIQYSLPNYSKILIQVYNSNGALVSELVNSSMQAGEYSITWDAADHASGIYFVKMIAGDFLQNQKLILMK